MAAKYLATTSMAGGTVYMLVRRMVDAYLLNDADGLFAFAPSDPYILLTENATERGVFEKSEARAAWPDGMYRATFYNQTGSSPAPESDSPPLTSQEFLVAGDVQISPLYETSDMRFLVSAAIKNTRDISAILSALVTLNTRVKSLESGQGSLEKAMERM